MISKEGMALSVRILGLLFQLWSRMDAMATHHCL